ncbi:MAG: pilus assembly protein [Chloroflexota bacterium]|nr:MAG: pilus assembly protein [Chloroflexota bacterium]
MTARECRRAKGGAGQALTEFALVIPIFLLVLYGIIEFGRYVYTVQVLNNAAREGARYAIVHGAKSVNPSGPMPGDLVFGVPTNPVDPMGDNVKDAVRNIAVGVINTIDFPAQTCPFSAPFPTNPCWDTSNQRGEKVTVVVRTTFTLLLPLPMPAITVEGSSTLVVNN